MTRVPRVSRFRDPGLGFETGARFLRARGPDDPPTVSSITARKILLFYPARMAWGLERWHGGHDLHFLTFSCYHRQPLLTSAHRCELFLQVLEEVGRRYQLVILGYVVMPEHVHLFLSEPQQRPLATAIQALEAGFARRLLAEQRRHGPSLEPRDIPQSKVHDPNPKRVWQARYYDFNVSTSEKRVEKLRYIHRNPVRRGLVEASELWPWSSFRAYACQEAGLVRVNDWGVLKLRFVEPNGFPV